ncbi:hypothetical protein [Sulfitobacter mediterraneus]|uniref:hypothetical protein n=1 Tax=Sulfitobacter mediterraneus TaxID=83219 RepID=UPI0021A892BC|nr:hypothetical protein [Sulfitobacter mediterraneus]UWR10298.1 hypothetical protein K3753_13675 [Sulfitobacter mediterraneus]
MRRLVLKYGLGVLVAALLSIASPQPAKAYQVDCAILLCLAGGWPASAECAHARAVFIRRITPWPIEPPLQIWRCPMGLSMNAPLQDRANPAQIILAQLAEGGGADIDISGFEFDFVRSIRVWDIRHYSHRERGRDDDCLERYSMNLGTYGVQGDFSWQRTTPDLAPTWVIPSRRCSSSNTRRGVGVEWEDHEGNHGYEWVAY